MRNWKKTFVPLTLAAMLAVPAAALAEEGGPPAAGPQVKLTVEQKLEKFQQNFQERSDKLLGLVQQYAPETLADWESAIADRKAVREEWIALAKEKGGAFKEEAKAKLAELKEKVQSGEITKEEAKAQIQAAREEFRNKRQEWRESRKEQRAPYKEARHELRAELKAALQSGDEAAVDGVLAKMLDEFKLETQALKDRLAEIKK